MNTLERKCTYYSRKWIEHEPNVQHFSFLVVRNWYRCIKKIVIIKVRVMFLRQEKFGRYLKRFQTFQKYFPLLPFFITERESSSIFIATWLACNEKLRKVTIIKKSNWFLKAEQIIISCTRFSVKFQLLWTHLFKRSLKWLEMLRDKLVLEQ